MLAMKEEAVCLKHRAVRFAAASRQIASKLAPTGFARAVGASLLAMKEDAVCLKHRAVRFAAASRQIASKLAPTGFARAVGASLLAMKEDAGVSETPRGPLCCRFAADRG
ncbi:hypothetical protein TRP66_09095 [Pseudomonas sp. JDS28PS106]|uniref:hypothetical protein n=1 Tax=Pseudomonas sp. JDS28PS106 TaxID=2497235 RepID=UPI002FD044E6